MCENIMKPFVAFSVLGFRPFFFPWTCLVTVGELKVASSAALWADKVSSLLTELTTFLAHRFQETWRHGEHFVFSGNRKWSEPRLTRVRWWRMFEEKPWAKSWRLFIQFPGEKVKSVEKREQQTLFFLKYLGILHKIHLQILIFILLKFSVPVDPDLTGTHVRFHEALKGKMESFCI